MSAGFTPGPWEVRPLGDRKYYGTHVRIGRNGGEIVVWTSDESPPRPSAREIASGWEEDYGFDHVETAECYANARLIAAAPELYEAAEEFLRLWSTGASRERAAHVAIELGHALTKGRGEQA